jgi:hypothetical protein
MKETMESSTLMRQPDFVQILNGKRFVWANFFLYLALALLRFLYIPVWFKGSIKLEEITFDSRSVSYALVEGAVISLLLFLYLFGIFNHQKWNWKAKDIVGLSLLLGGLAFLAPPANSIDVFNYVGFGRIAMLYGQNPYLHGYGEISDAYSPLAWFTSTMPYGPATLPLFSIAGWLSQWNVFLGIYCLKAFFFLSHGLSLCLLKKIFAKKGETSTSNLYLFALNPLLILECIADVHTEALLLTLFLLAIYAIYHGRFFLAFAAAFLALAVKLPPGLILLVTVGFYLFRNRKLTALASGLLLILSGSFFLRFTLLTTNGALKSLLNPVVVPNPNSIFNLPLYLGFTVPVLENIRLACLVLYFCLFVWRLSVIKQVEDFVRESALLMLGLILLCAYQFCPWYVLWLFPFAVVSDSIRLKRLVIALASTIQLLYIVPSFFFKGSILKQSLRLVVAHLLPYLSLLPVRASTSRQTSPENLG